MQLRKLFFPHQEVRANPEFNRQGRMDGTAVETDFEFNTAQRDKGLFFASLKLKSDDTRSENSPYSFCMESFCIVECTADEMSDPAKLQYTVFSIMLGSVRERIAELTARGPFETFMLAPAGIPKFPDTFEPGEQVVTISE